MEIGSQLSHYKITAKLGEGGMGQVFRAEDSTLKRDVAIKVLPPDVAGDPDRMRRLEREAQLLAQLDHPNIASIHGLEETDGVRFLVMQVAEGQTLHQRLDAGPMPLSEALPVALQIARALESAHDKGVVHRDLKPANVMVADDGSVKLLDFGLAKIFAGDASGSSSRVSESTELASTQPGLILGTAGYMSPEQARGRSVDRRTDVWAFGCVLFEMLTAQRTFAGETVTDVLGAIVHRDPDWDLLPAGTPRRIRALLHRCLRKDVGRRIQAIGDARVSIEEYLEDPQAAEAILDGGTTARGSWRAFLPWGVAAVLAVSLGAALMTGGGESVDPPTLRLDMAVGVADDLRDLSLGSSLVLSKDGSQIVVATGNNQDSRLQIRHLDSTNANTLTGGGAYNPFFSPDGAWVGFALATSLQKVPTTGGTPLRIVDVNRSRGADWGDNGEIVFAPSPNSGLMVVSADGGEATPVTTLDESVGEVTHRWPQVLPGGAGCCSPLTWRPAAGSMRRRSRSSTATAESRPSFTAAATTAVTSSRDICCSSTRARCLRCRSISLRFRWSAAPRRSPRAWPTTRAAAARSSTCRATASWSIAGARPGRASIPRCGSTATVRRRRSCPRPAPTWSPASHPTAGGWR